MCNGIQYSEVLQFLLICFYQIKSHLYISGIIAVSLAAGQSFDERTENMSRMNTSPSLILIWSFVDPIQPKVINTHILNYVLI